MPNALIRGLASGALGTTALNMTTYLDMAIRGRPSSSVPAQDVEDVANQMGVDLAAGGSDDKAENRKQGLGALLGYVTGLSIGAVYGMVRPLAPDVPAPVAAVAVGLGAMAATDGVTILLGNADPRKWPASSWVMDIVPHLAYGAVTVAGYESFDD
jgi:hypothetical protein